MDIHTCNTIDPDINNKKGLLSLGRQMWELQLKLIKTSYSRTYYWNNLEVK